MTQNDPVDPFDPKATPEPPFQPYQPYQPQTPPPPPYAAHAHEPGAPGAPASSGTFDIGQAFSWAWAKFTPNAGVLVGITALVVGSAVLLQVVLGVAALGAWSAGSYNSGGFFLLAVLTMLTTAVTALVALFLGMALSRAALDIAGGRLAQFAPSFRMTDALPYLLVQIIATVATVIVTWVLGIIPVLGTILGIVATLAASAISLFASFRVLDRRDQPISALMAGFELVRANPGVVALLFIVLGVLNFVGALPFGLGLLVTVPLSALVGVYAYRRLQRQPIG